MTEFSGRTDAPEVRCDLTDKSEKSISIAANVKTGVYTHTQSSVSVLMCATSSGGPLIAPPPSNSGSGSVIQRGTVDSQDV